MPVPFSATNFTGGGGMTWTVTAPNMIRNSYTLIGKTVIWMVMITSSVLGGTPSGQLLLTVPGMGLAGGAGTQTGTVTLMQDGNGARVHGFLENAGTTQLRVQRYDSLAFTLGSQCFVFFTFVGEFV
jgi:hypothetical protein